MLPMNLIHYKILLKLFLICNTFTFFNPCPNLFEQYLKLESFTHMKSYEFEFFYVLEVCQRRKSLIKTQITLNLCFICCLSTDLFYLNGVAANEKCESPSKNGFRIYCCVLKVVTRSRVTFLT